MRRTHLFTALIASTVLVVIDGSLNAHARSPAEVTHDVETRSSFGPDDSDHGWTSNDGAQALEVESGVLLVKDISDDWHWLTAPKKFHGNWRDVDHIQFRVRADHRRDTSEAIVVQIAGDGGVATQELHSRLVLRGTWRTVRVPLKPVYWRVKGSWPDIVKNVARFRLRLDLNGSNGGGEVVSLDDVRLVKSRSRSMASDLKGWRARGGTVRVDGEQLLVEDTAQGWCWLRAPESFRRDWREAKHLTIRVLPDPEQVVNQTMRIQIEGSFGMAYRDIPTSRFSPGNESRIDVPLSHHGWVVSGNWHEITKHVSDFWIRVDLTAHKGRGEVTRIVDIRVE